MNRRMLFMLAGAMSAVLPTIAFAETELTVYTAVEAVDLDRYKETFEKAHPDIKINWVRDSTGVMTAKLLAEKDNPQADVVWGVAATSLLLLKTEGMLEPYQPKDVEALDKKFVDKDTPPSWVGMDAYVAALCYNTVEGEKLGLTPPTSWEDLTKPEYKGHIVMPNPASSGTGFLDVSGWMQMWGEEKAWGFMDKLHENISAYTHSGSKPCKMAGAGEAVIGVSFEFPAPRPRAPARPSTSSSPPRARAGRPRRRPSSPARRISKPPRRWSTGRSPRKPTRCTMSAMPWSPIRASQSRSSTCRRTSPPR